MADTHGKIRKLSLGDEPGDKFTYVVGKQAGNKHTIALIKEDESFMSSYGVVRYLILVRENKVDNGPLKVWKKITGHAITVEYEL